MTPDNPTDFFDRLRTIEQVQQTQGQSLAMQGQMLNVISSDVKSLAAAVDAVNKSKIPNWQVILAAAGIVLIGVPLGSNAISNDTMRKVEAAISPIASRTEVSLAERTEIKADMRTLAQAQSDMLNTLNAFIAEASAKETELET